jgi:hypothetical protein
MIVMEDQRYLYISGYLISSEGRNDTFIMPRPAHLRKYGDRGENATNPTAKLLLQIMERKKTNLAVSVDVTTSENFLIILEAVGPYVCLIKASDSDGPVKNILILTITSRLT